MCIRDRFFLIASPRERARRRATQEGRPELESEYASELERRDRLDSTREDSPLRQAEDAVLVATDGLEPEAVTQRLIDHIRGSQV